MNSIPRQLLLQLILILFNAFFAMTEIAVISLNSAKLKKLIDDGDKKAAKLLRLVEQPTGFLSTIQIGITLAGFLGSAFAADSFSDGLADWIYNGLGFHALSEYHCGHHNYDNPFVFYAYPRRACAQAHRHAEAVSGR